MIPTIRFPDWDRRMAAEIERQRGMEFAYGQHDCCLFAADVVLAMTGYDPAEGLRGNYSTPAEAVCIMTKCGGMENFISDMLRVNPLPGREARRGDVVMMRKLRGAALSQLGVCVGDEVLVAAKSCLCQRSLKHAVVCWRID